MSTSSLELRAGELRLALAPELGGSIAGMWLGALPILRSSAPGDLTCLFQPAGFARGCEFSQAMAFVSGHPRQSAPSSRTSMSFMPSR